MAATLEEIKASEQDQSGKLDTLSQDLNNVSRKVDILIVQGATGGGTVDQIAMNQIAELQAQVTAQIAAASETLKALESRVDAALGPHVEPHR